ncbi:MAG: hypothetical protein J0M08_10440, partial [Bacteroidetes bacterium]|nr:hypothetical protein [Bacteroidota bacterium]
MLKKSLVLFLLTVNFAVFAQTEVELDLQANPTLIGFKAPSYKMQSAPDTLSLPFIDDFSYDSYYPSAEKWFSVSTFVNRFYPKAPPTIGVATFDGLNYKGYPYNFSASSNSSNFADTLLSKYIRLNTAVTPADSVYFSFFYQAKGWGNEPEVGDSLVLEFKKNGAAWVKVWGRKGYTPNLVSDTGFHLVHIPVIDSSYFKDNFQFRFRNKATLSGALDHWHVDYIYLNKNRSVNDTVFTDISFTYNPGSFLRNYTAMPWQQYTSADMKDSLVVFMRNNSSSAINIGYTDSVVSNTNSLIDFYNAGNCNVNPFVSAGYASCLTHQYPQVGFSFPTLTDSALFTANHRIYPSSFDQIAENNFVQYKQKFYNYFAHDDGTAESGYGLTTGGAKLGYRFALNFSDTLRAVRLFFNPILNAANGFPFRLAIWDDNGGLPNNLVYKDSIVYPKYSSDYNEFVTYLITNPALVLSAGTYYIGIIQTTANLLNIGLDKNINSQSQTFYMTSGFWQQST